MHGLVISNCRLSKPHCAAHFPNLEILSLRDKSGILIHTKGRDPPERRELLGNIEKTVIFLLFSMLSKLALYLTEIPT